MPSKIFLDTLLLKIGRVGGNKWWDEGHWKVPVYNLEPPALAGLQKIQEALHNSNPSQDMEC